MTRNVLDVQKPGLKGRTRWTQSGCGFGRPRPVTVSPSGLGGSGGGCIFRERGDWREAARLPVLSPGENSKFGGYRRGLLMPTVKLFWRFMSVFLT